MQKDVSIYQLINNNVLRKKLFFEKKIDNTGGYSGIYLRLVYVYSGFGYFKLNILVLFMYL